MYSVSRFISDEKGYSYHMNFIRYFNSVKYLVTLIMTSSKLDILLSS